MRMRGVLRYKESGKPKARLVIIGYHDPRVGSDVPTGAPGCLTPVEEVRFSRQPLTISSPLKRGDVKNAFLQGTFDNKRCQRRACRRASP